MENAKKIETLKKAINSKFTPDHLKEKMKAELAKLESQSQSQSKPEPKKPVGKKRGPKPKPKTEPKSEPKKETSDKIPMFNIEILWAEGTTSEYDKFPKKYKTWKEANDAVIPVYKDLTKHGDLGGYNKVKFIVTFEDGDTYEGRLDVSTKYDNPTESNGNVFGKHIKDFLEYIISDKSLEAGYKIEDQAEAKQYLATYDLGLDSSPTKKPSSKKTEYKSNRDIDYIIVLENGKEVAYSGKDVYEGANFEKGGNLENKISEGNIVKYSSPVSDEEGKLRFVVLESHYNNDNPRVHIQVLGSNLSFPPIEVVKVSDVEFVSDGKLEKGGKLGDKSKYFPVRDVVSVHFKDGSVDKPLNGYHVKLYAKPIDLKSLTKKTSKDSNKTSVDGKELKAYPVDIWVPKDQTNDIMNLLNTKFHSIYLVTDGGHGYVKINSNEPHLKLETKEFNIMGKKSTHKFAVPVNFDDTSKSRKMFGGTFIWSMDSRFVNEVSELPLHLHDRVEKYDVGGQVELPSGSFISFENYYLEKGDKLPKSEKERLRKLLNEHDPKILENSWVVDESKWDPKDKTFTSEFMKEGKIKEGFDTELDAYKSIFDFYGVKFEPAHEAFDLQNFFVLAYPKVKEELAKHKITLHKDFSIKKSGNEYLFDAFIKQNKNSISKASKIVLQYTDYRNKEVGTITFEPGEMEFHLDFPVWKIKSVDLFEKGGVVYHEDLFYHFENQPEELSKIVDEYFEKQQTDGVDYDDTRKLLDNVEKIGYTFEYGLDNEPYGLRPIGTQIKEEFKKGGKIKSSKKTNKPSSTKKRGNPEMMKLAKEIRKDGEKWTDAVKRAAKQLNK